MTKKTQQTDYISMWFDVRKEQGINDDMNLGLIDTRTQLIDWNVFRHRDMDGLGGIATIFRQHGYPSRELPKSSDKQPPSLWKLFLLMWRMPKIDVPKAIKWRQTFPDFARLNPDNSNDAPISSGFFTTEETVVLKRLAKKHGVTLGVYIFWALNKSVADNLLENNQEYYWFYPVNLRGALDFGDDTRNYSSGVNVLLSNTITPKEIQARIKTQIKSKAYWVLWWQANIGKLIGLKGVRWLYQLISERQFYAGSFSFLGGWPLQDVDNPPVPEGKVWVACGIGTKNYPVSTGTLLWNGQLTLGLKLHPFICNDAHVTDLCLQGWKQNLMSGDLSSRQMPLHSGQVQ